MKTSPSADPAQAATVGDAKREPGKGVRLASLRAELRLARARADASAARVCPSVLAPVPASALDELRHDIAQLRAVFEGMVRRELARARQSARSVRSFLREGRPGRKAKTEDGFELEWSSAAAPGWGDPVVSAVIWEDAREPLAARELARAAGRQSLEELEIVLVAPDGLTASRLDRAGGVLETWDLQEPVALARTVLGKYVCLLEPSFAALPPTFLEMNALALEGHNLDFTVNGFGPESLLEGALLEGRLPDTAAGATSRPLLVFRAECLGEEGTFSPDRLEGYGRPLGRVVGRGLRHELAPGVPFESPAEWRRRLDLGDRLRSNGHEFVLAATAGAPVHATLRDFSEGARLPPTARAGRPRVLVSFPFLALGGAEKLTYDVLDRLRERFEFVILTAESPDASVGSTVAAFRRLTPLVYLAPDFLHPRLTTALAAYLVRKLGIEILFVPNGSNWFYDALPGLKARFPELRVVNQVFDHNFGWINRYTPELASRMDAHLAPNRPIADAYARFGVPAERIRLIHHGIDLAAFDPASCDASRRAALKRAFGLETGPRVVSFIARLHPQKRPTDFLRLAERFSGDPDYTFLMVGDGPAASEVTRMAGQLKLANLRRLPFHEPVQEVIAVTDLLVIPSEYEGLPLVLLNCLAMGVPAVSTDVGAIREVLTPEIGSLVDRVGDIRALEEGVRRLAGRLGPDLSARARERVAVGFDIAAVAESYARALAGGPA